MNKESSDHNKDSFPSQLFLYHRMFFKRDTTTLLKDSQILFCDQKFERTVLK